MRRLDEQISDLPEVGEAERCRDVDRGSEPDDVGVLLGHERMQPAGNEAVLEPVLRPRVIGRLAVVNAVPVEDLGERGDLAAGRRGQNPYRGRHRTDASATAELESRSAGRSRRLDARAQAVSADGMARSLR